MSPITTSSAKAAGALPMVANRAAAAIPYFQFFIMSSLGKVQSYAKIMTQLVHVGLELRVGNHVDDAPALHHVMPIGHGGAEAEILLDQQHGEADLLELAHGHAD